VSRWSLPEAYLRFGIGRIGWPAALGLLLLALAALAYPTAMQDLASRQAEVAADISRRQQQLAAAPGGGRGDGPGVAQAAHRNLPGPAAAEALVRRLHESARELGVQIADSEYRPGRTGAGGLIRYQMTLPVRGTYPQIRRWLAEAMNREPALALEELNLKRDDAGAGEIEARLRLILFLRAA
jgi:hypothetical protein